MSISGSFGELRGNHFHSGIDYKTGGKEGIPVFSAEDGFVYRVLVSRTGYGKAIYIKHKNDITTVYAHLRAFAGTLANTVIDKQYAQENFEIDYFPKSEAFPIKKGELIGYSGNSGSSEGPHLHFETRHSMSEMPFDPSNVGFTYPDTLAPILEQLFVYDLIDTSLVFPLPEPKSWFIKNNDTIEVSKAIALGLSISDKAGMELNRLGVRDVKVFSNNQMFFHYRLEPFTFAQSKHITAVIDQRLKLRGIESFLCLKASGNNLPFYDSKTLGGIMQFQKNELKKCMIQLEDMQGNISSYVFWMRNSPSDITVQSSDYKNCRFVESGKKTILESGLVKVEIDSISLHGKSCVSLDSLTTNDDGFGVYKFGPDGISIFKPIKVFMRTINIPKKLLRKTVMMRSKDGIEWFANNETLNGDYIVSSTSSAGYFSLKYDTNGPKIGKASYFQDEYSNSMSLLVTVYDDFSGVESIQCKIQGKWVLSEFNSNRNSLIIYDINKFTGKRLRLLAVDKKGNKSKSKIMLNLE